MKALWTDHPMKSIDRAMWWIEYVLRHNGTRHLRSPTADVSWAAYLLLDVILVIVSVITISILLIYKLLAYLLGRILYNNKVKQA